MAKKRQIEKTKSNKKSDQTIYRLRRDYSTPELCIELGKKMITLVNEKKYTLMSQIARDLDYTFEELQKLAQDHYQIQEAYDICRMQCGLNAYQGIEDRTLSGTFSKYAVTKYNKEVRAERDRIKLEEHEREIAKIKARQEADKNSLSELITEVREIGGKKIGVIKVDENITYQE